MQDKDIFNAIATDDLDRVKELISEDNKIVNKINVHGVPILILAIHQNNVAIVRELCIHNANVNILDSHERTPLYYASELNYTEIMLELYRWGADDNEARTSESILNNANSYCKFCGLHMKFCPTHKNKEDLYSLYIEMCNLNLL
jgi:ankyrin repeat protein